MWHLQSAIDALDLGLCIDLMHCLEAVHCISVILQHSKGQQVLACPERTWLTRQNSDADHVLPLELSFCFWHSRSGCPVADENIDRCPGTYFSELRLFSILLPGFTYLTHVFFFYCLFSFFFSLLLTFFSFGLHGHCQMKLSNLFCCLFVFPCQKAGLHSVYLYFSFIICCENQAEALQDTNQYVPSEALSLLLRLYEFSFRSEP